ncbi:MAG TPA: error-prone DNA polymerase [Pseudolabrys sp.]|nr:error-prone DNA polymerase [Pseudolabrys sp.]
MRYIEFAVASNFSFLRGASHPEELMVQAAHLGLAGIGLCDRNSVAGVVRAHLAKREQNLPLRYHPGARLVFADGTPDILAYPRTRAGWGRLTRLLTLGNLRARKGECILRLDDLLSHIFGLELVVMDKCTASLSPQRQRSEESLRKAIKNRNALHPSGEKRPRNADQMINLLSALGSMAPQRVRLAASMLYQGRDGARLQRTNELAHAAGIPLIAVNDVLYHHPDRRRLADVLTCIREKTTIDAAGRKLAANAERHLKPPQEILRLFRALPEAVEETVALSDALSFSLDELRYEYPDETIEGFDTAQDALVYLTYEGATHRYPQGLPAKVRANLEHELKLIAQLEYAPYFLTVHDIVRYAREKGILCQGRGSAANSAVCFCLGITEVDPDRADLLFERFISPERREPPDIDVDFEHERREEVIQYIYGKYGRERAGIAATVISYRGRSAIREVGKAFGLSEDAIGALSSSIWGGGGGAVSREAVVRTGLDPQSRRMRQIIALAHEINGFPRHLSQHVGGFVITRSQLDEVVPIGNAAMDDRTFVEWDKDDLDALGILKIDVLGLGMLSCIRKALDLVEKHYGKRLSLATIPAEDPAVYRMLCRADSLGVFQVESRAQMTMLPRLQPRNFYDLVIEVAIVRPGPIQGDMVHPYLRRRRGEEEVTYPSRELEAVLRKTLGVPLFQEQAMKIAIVAAGFTPSEADKLRRAMATFKRVGTIGTFQRKMIEGMLANGYQREFAERCFQQIEGFGEYGFPESHAASFALLVYASAWLKCHYPDVFAAALLNAQPMGFYAPAQIVRDAREHGVEVRPPDVNHSSWDATLEGGPRASDRLHQLHREMHDDVHSMHAVRLGLREIKALKEKDAKLIVDRRVRLSWPGSPGPSLLESREDVDSRHKAGHDEIIGAYDSVRDVWLRTGLSSRVLERLADADAFGSLGLPRREALWAAKALGRVGDRNDNLPLFAGGQRDQDTANDRLGEPDVCLPPMLIGEEVINDYRFLHLSLRAHPAQFLRRDLDAKGIQRNELLRSLTNNTRVRISGLVTCRQRPGSANGVVFMTIEDETAVANVIVWPKVFERLRPVVLGARYVSVSGPMQEEAGVIHVIAEQIEDFTPFLTRLAERGGEIDGLARCDEVRRPIEEQREARLLGGRQNRLLRLMREMPELAADLDVPARGSAHGPSRRAV